jgi:hypothetical protein
MKRLEYRIGGMALSCALLFGLFAPVQAADDDRPPDERLAAKLRLDVVDMPLTDLCWIVEKRTGIAHSAGQPQAGDLRASVVGEMTVGQFQRAIAEALGLEWTRSEQGGQSRYVARLDPRRAAEEARVLADTDRMFREDLRWQIETAKLSDEALAKLPLTVRSRLTNPDALRLLGLLSPLQLSRVMEGDEMVHDMAALSPSSQALLRNLTDASNRRIESEKIRLQNDPRVSFRTLDLQDGAQWRVRIAPFYQQMIPGTVALMVSVFSPTEPGVGFAVNVRVNPEAQRDLQTPRIPLPRSPESAAISQQAMPPQFGPRTIEWDHFLRELERTTGRPVVSDAYLPPLYTIRPGPTARAGESLEAYLDRVSRFTWRTRWGCVGPVLTFQRPDWAILRRSEVPESLLRRWKRHIIETGRWSPEHILEAASLTPHQFPNLRSVMGRTVDPIVEQRDALLLWRDTPEGPRRRATTIGMLIRDLPVGLQPRARELVSGLLGSREVLVLANARIRVDVTEDHFTLSIQSPGREDAVRRIDLACPSFLVENLRRAEEARVAALTAAAGVNASSRT